MLFMTRYCLAGSDLRHALPSSMESSPASHQTGLSTTLGFTLASLASQSNMDRSHRGYGDQHFTRPASAQAENFNKNADMGQYDLRSERREPVEHGNPEYGNTADNRRDQSPQALVSEHSASRLTGASSAFSRRSMKPPKPMPRSRSSLASRTLVKSGSVQAQPSSDEPFEIVDRPATAIPPHLQSPRHLGMITEQPVQPVPEQLRFNSPTELTQHVATLDSDRAEQTCTVCRNNYPHLSERQFLDHCIECANSAALEEEGQAVTIAAPVGVTIATPETGADLKACPVCQQTFGYDVSQEDFENHVQSHFRD